MARFWAGQRLSLFFFQPLRPPSKGQRELSRFSKSSIFRPLEKGRKRLQFPHCRAILYRQRGVAAMEDFRPKLIVLNFASPQDLFSTGQFAVLHLDFLRDFLKCSNLVNEFFGNVRNNVFCVKPVARIWCNPEDLFSIGQILVLPVDFLVRPFQELEPCRRVLWDRAEKRLLRESRREHFVHHRGPFLVRPFLGFACRFLSRLSQELRSGQRVLREHEEKRLLREARRLHSAFNGGPFLTRRFSVLPVGFFQDFLKSWVLQGLHLVSKLGDDVSTQPRGQRTLDLLRTTQRTGSPWTSRSTSLTSGQLLSPTSLGKTCSLFKRHDFQSSASHSNDHG